MAEYIEREAVLRRMQKIATEAWKMRIKANVETVWNEAQDVLRFFPAADVRPVKWIPVTERLPEDLQNVLVIDDGRVTIGHCEHYYGEEEVYVEWHDTLYYPINPPYWMPLPSTDGLYGGDRR